MTYNVFGGTLNLTQPTNHTFSQCLSDAPPAIHKLK